MAYDFSVEKDGIIKVRISDHYTSKTIFEGTFQVKNGQKINYEIYSEDNEVLRER